MTVIRLSDVDRRSPLDVFEQMISANNWSFDRPSEDELAARVPGRWCDYGVYAAWSTADFAMHITLAFDTRVPKEKRSPVYELLALANEKLWMGHFGLWQSEGLLAYQHSIPLRGSTGLSIEQTEDLMETALADCERFYPAFQYVIWGGRSAEQAIASAMIDTVGEA